MTTSHADEVKACCSAAYGGAAARFLLGESFHPGGVALTRRLIKGLELSPGKVVVDVASGRGTSALLAAQETGCDAIGVDLSAANVAEASQAAGVAGLADRVRFVEGDAERLPLPDAEADAALCECSLCLFPDGAAAAAELARVLRPGGHLALSDVVADPERLPEDLLGLDAWASCVANARPLPEVAALLLDAGFAELRLDRHDGAVSEMIDQVEARLRLARTLGSALPDALRDGAARGLQLVAAARSAVAEGVLGYGAVIARRR